MTSNIILNAIKKTTSTITSLKLEYCIFGGLAMQFYKRIRATKDIDLMVLIDKIDIDGFISQMGKSGLKIEGEGKIIKIGNFDLIRFIYTDSEISLDVFIDIVLVKTDFQRQILSRKNSFDFFGINLNVASCEDLILLKILSGRPIDIYDATGLIQENNKELDRAYLKNCSEKLGIKRKTEELLK